MVNTQTINFTLDWSHVSLYKLGKLLQGRKNFSSAQLIFNNILIYSFHYIIPMSNFYMELTWAQVKIHILRHSEQSPWIPYGECETEAAG